MDQPIGQEQIIPSGSVADQTPQVALLVAAPCQPQTCASVATQGQQNHSQQQPQQSTPTRSKATRIRPEHLGCVGGLIYAVNRPWLLVTLPILLGGTWLVNNPQVIINNLDKPYLLFAGPATVASILAAWLVVKFFKTIEAWCIASWRAFQKGRQEDATGQFFWFTIAIFMAVSVLESGQFFDTIIPHVLPGLGYATALVIDLIAVNLMQARLEAVRMHDKKGAWLYLIGVAFCAGLSAFANLYTGLSGYNHSVSGMLPTWMNQIAPWLAMAFPAMILLMSITADYTADRTSTKLDADKYRTQEEKRIKVLEVRRDMEQRRLKLDQELLQIQQERANIRGERRDREFILLRIFFPRKTPSVTQISEQVLKQTRTELSPLFEQIDGKLNSLSSAHLTNLGQIQQMGKGLEQVHFEMNLLVQEWQNIKNLVLAPAQIDEQIRTILEQNIHEKEALKKGKIRSNMSLKLERPHPEYSRTIATQLGHQKGLQFTPDYTHREALHYLKKHPHMRAQFESILHTNPIGCFEQIANGLQQNGLNQGFVTPQFVSEVWALLPLEEEAISNGSADHVTSRPGGGTHPSDLHPRTPNQPPKVSKRTSAREPVKLVKAPSKPANESETTVNVQGSSELGEYQEVHPPATSTSPTDDQTTATETRAPEAGQVEAMPMATETTMLRTVTDQCHFGPYF